MKRSDEFKVARMLDELPEQHAGASMDQKFARLKSRLSSAPEVQAKHRSKRIGYSIAASILMFGIGFLLANYLHSDRIEHLQSAYADMRSLLIQSLPADQGTNGKLRAFDHLINSEHIGYNADELIQIYEGTEDENLKLAALNLLDGFMDEQDVMSFLEERLEEEESPLLLIPMINLITEAKTRKGMDALKRLEDQDAVHPAVKDHLKAIEL